MARDPFGLAWASGGGMGGMGGGMMGGMMSVPATGEPFAALKPNESKNLKTRGVSFQGPDADGHIALAKEGEKLRLGVVSDLSRDARVQAAYRRLSEEKAPSVITQLVLWNVGQNLDWTTIAELSKKWANPQELALARQFVVLLDQTNGVFPRDEKLGIAEDTGILYFDVTSSAGRHEALAKELRTLLDGKRILGLKSRIDAPAAPQTPSIVCHVKLNGTLAKPEAVVQVEVSNDQTTGWTPMGKFTLPIGKGGEIKATDVATDIGEGLLGRLVRAQLIKGQRVKGKQLYQIRIDNASSLVLNGFAIAGSTPESSEKPSVVAGLSISPKRSWSIPASADFVEKLGLKNGLRIVAVDLSGL